MVKFNKRCTSRKKIGEELGSVIKADILKLATSATKSTSDGSIGLQLQEKDLGDDGLRVVCEGLCEAYQSQPKVLGGLGALRLEEIHLVQCKISANGLKYLGKVIRLAGHHLKELHLKRNDISVVTEEDARSWQEFLEAFTEVSCLRILDLSENPIGNYGFEILWRVHTRAKPINLPRPRRERSVMSDDSDAECFDSEDDTEDDSDELIQSLYISSTHTSSFKSELDSTVQELSVLGGLRSVPYIILSQVEITDCMALCLSYILPTHPVPERIMKYHLMDESKNSTTAEALEKYYLTGCRGIVYHLPNEKSKDLQTRVIKSSEALRDGRTVTVIEPEPNITPRGPGVKHYEVRPKVTQPKGLSFELRNEVPTGSTRVLESARSKIEGELLKSNGPHCVKLWITALRVLCLARQILFDPNADPSEAILKGSGRRHFSAPPNAGSRTTVTTVHHGPSSPPDSPTRRGSPGTLVVPDSAYDSSSVKSDSTTSSHVLIGKLPERIWREIIRLEADPDGLLSTTQFSTLCDWAKVRYTLEKEREQAGQHLHAQIWRFLQGVDCLSYQSEDEE
ncbi:Similar to hypothetical protein AOL_s00215g100 [Arthrobotrys oligospora ATCC 24927]; acc. no. EGX43364 [Pyronema omphalodes CBS 100304]|uniref:Uncharacterized protein n=1 Tax=Pyronema omphalodes (strain CBS 100304) TaxID=1076935 RepID=U4L8M3_PYROM|nr:Similar to hypothetical protein AOL_s00215g100 [Arthrobotrys oligospora ATCC 24927]; acc. no. EGX43364 [Pyronema omphalodes CBS 100304]